MPAKAAPAMPPTGSPPVSAPTGWTRAGLRVVGGGTVAGEVVAAAANATTRSAEGATRSPSPTAGVGKWLSGRPIEACRRTEPVAGSSP